MIRPAVVQDAAALAQVHVAAWRAAYRGIMPDDVLDQLDVEQRRAGWHDRLANGASVLVADDDSGLVGFLAFGPTRDADRMGCGEVYALNIRPDSWRHGWGRALLAGAIAALPPPPPLLLWVLADNTRARQFYESQGWAFDGTAKESPWGPMELRYVLSSA